MGSLFCPPLAIDAFIGSPSIALQYILGHHIAKIIRPPCILPSYTQDPYGYGSHKWSCDFSRARDNPHSGEDTTATARLKSRLQISLKFKADTILGYCETAAFTMAGVIIQIPCSQTL